MSELANSFAQLGVWREALSASIARLRRWLAAVELLDGDAARRIDLALDRLSSDRLVIAFVAEFSRGKSELINAMFFADYGRRILPSAAGRTTMCPTELLYDESLPPCIRALPIETRARLGNTPDFKRTHAEWRVFPLDTNSPEGMLAAFKMVAETIRVTIDEARMYGLYDPDDPDQEAAVDAEGMVEISRWRHAVINFPHPLLQRGLVILDTPGLNAIGTEPELTLALVPGAHAVLFVLAADTGVTRSDLGVWRHIVGRDGQNLAHLAILNKIDGLWDPLRTPAETEAEIQRQIHSVADTLHIDASRVFPVSAQKGLVGKVTGDADLLRRSRLPELEAALVNLLVPGRRESVLDNTLRIVDRVAGEARQTLAARERSLVEQVYELQSLKGKNQGAVERMYRRATDEQQEFEGNVRRIAAARTVLTRLSDEALGLVRLQALREQVLATRERLRKTRLTPQFLGVVRDYFRQMREQLRRANEKLAEIERMVLGVQRRFAEDAGWSLQPPMAFSLETYVAEVDRLEEAYKAHFGAITLLTRDKWSLIERFFDTVVGKSRSIYSAAERDSDAWVRSLLPPLEMQVREQRQQLRKRAEAATRIRDAQDSLELRIAQLEGALKDAQTRRAELQRLSEDIRVPQPMPPEVAAPAPQAQAPAQPPAQPPAQELPPADPAPAPAQTVPAPAPPDSGLGEPTASPAAAGG